MPAENFSLQPDDDRAEIPPPPKRRAILTRKEQTALAFLLALLILGGIVRKLRTEWPVQHSGPALIPTHGQN
jgi:hypothetical protein